MISGYLGWVDEQIEGWKIMLDRDVSFSSMIIFITSIDIYGVALYQAEGTRTSQGKTRI